MTLSRTARILIALLLVAAAAFIWLNLFVASPASGPILTRTAATPAQAANDPAAPSGEDAGDVDPFAQAEDADAPADDGEGPGELPFITIPADGGDDADAPADGATSGVEGEGPQAPTVVAPDEATVVGRDVIVAEFPFLITAPPLTEGAQEPAAGAAAAGASRPGTVARANVNPFSPIVVQAPPEAQAPAGPPPAGPEVVEVEVPSGPPQAAAAPAGRSSGAAAAPTPAVPAPRPMAPNTAGARQLPRALPSGTMPVAPDLLREPRAEAAPRTPVTVPNVAIREPGAESAGAPALAPVGTDLTAGAAGELAPLGPGEVPASGRTDMPLVAGADPLNRYLRDHNVTFTGSVVGSVGVGVFRTIDRNAPIVLALGQALPETDIVLTDLRGQAAEFTLGDTSQVLNLDLRR